MTSNRTINTRLYIGSALALLLTLFTGIFSYLALNRQIDDAAITRHTYQVLNQLRQIENNILHMANSRAAYRATRDKGYLETYFVNDPQLQSIIAGIGSLTEDNPTQIANVARLKKEASNLQGFWKVLGVDDSFRFSTDGNKLITQQEAAHIAAVARILSSMELEEQKLLQQRTESSAIAAKKATNQVVVGTLLTLFIVGAMVWAVLRELRMRQQKEREIEENMAEIQRIHSLSEHQNWLLQGAQALNAAILEMDNPEDTARKVLMAYADYMRLPGCALHLSDENGKLFKTISVGLETDPEVDQNLQLAGLAVQKGAPHFVRDVPAHYWKIASGTGEAAPGTLGLWPVFFDETLMGVLEIAVFGQFADRKIDLIQSTIHTVSAALFAAMTRDKAARFLEQIQAQSEELLSQQEELRQTNEELTNQAESLQASEEELRVQQEELRQINEELTDRNQAVETARLAVLEKAKELEITSRYKSEFLANMSHELRTPLNSVLILAKLLQENTGHNLTEKQVEYAGVIHKSGTDLLDLINDILDLSKIESGKIDFLFEQIPAENILRDIRPPFEAIAQDKGIRFETQLQPEAAAPFNTDKARLEQILKNLLSNAFKFTPKGGQVTLSVTQPKDENGKPRTGYIAFAVKDSGIGIPAEKHRVIFEAFKQADGSTSRKYGGTGLGLSISRELARRLGGDIYLESTPGAGSSFAVIVPVAGPADGIPEMPFADPKELAALAETAPENIPEQEIVADDRRQIAPHDKVMLIVEDDPRFAAIVRDFARQRGYKALVAMQGDEGLLYARRYKPAAIILDMQLPVIDGWALLKILKDDPELQKIPVHIVSAADDSSLHVSGALAAARKPVEKSDLEGAFQVIANHLKNNLQQILVYGEGHFDEEQLRKMLRKRGVTAAVRKEKDLNRAVELLREDNFQCVVADLGNCTTLCLPDLERLRAASKDSLLMVYLNTNISISDELALKKIADVIIRESLQSKERLLDELELFHHKMQQATRQSVTPAEALAGGVTLEGRKVLLVDDDMRNIFSLTSLLEGKKVDILTALDGREALKVMDENPDVELVLMDIMMPEMDGYEATRRLRMDHRFKRLPIIALTAKAMLGDREKCLEAGASDYITKPVDGVRLLSLMRVWLAK